jgi:hypothetical protein
MAWPDVLVRAVDGVARRPSRLFTVALLLITLTGWLDHVTGTQVSLSPLYTVPIAVGTWYLGRRKGVALAI